MSESWPSRVGITDEKGNYFWFNPNEAIASWEPDTLLNCGRPIQGFVLPVICHMPSGIWCLWDSNSIETMASRRAQVLKESEAVKQILLWNLDPGKYGQDALDASNIGTSKAKNAFLVFDVASKREVRFDPTDCQKWEASGGESWNSFEACFLYYVDMTLFRYPSGHWVKITVRTHSEVENFIEKTLTRFSDQQAADWLLQNGFEIPEDLQSLVADQIFDPRKPIVEVEADTAKHQPIRPRWDAVSRQLYYGDSVIRTVAAKAKNVILILDAFEESGWPDLIDSPFPGHEDGMGKRRETLRSLNDRLACIVFEADGTGEGIRWRPLIDWTEHIESEFDFPL